MTPERPSNEAEAEDEDWQRLVTEQFFNGYAESDSIYDRLTDDASSAPSEEEMG
jgi:predicted secreted protein